jgi:hypothetical protein
MTQDNPSRCTLRPVRFIWRVWAVAIGLLCAAAHAVIVDDDYETGSGSSFFQVALVADPHNAYDNLRAIRDTINSLVEKRVGDIKDGCGPW